MEERLSCPKCNETGRIKQCPNIKFTYYGNEPYCQPDCMCEGSMWIPVRLPRDLYETRTHECPLCEGKKTISWERG